MSMDDVLCAAMMKTTVVVGRELQTNNAELTNKNDIPVYPRVSQTRPTSVPTPMYPRVSQTRPASVPSPVYPGVSRTPECQEPRSTPECHRHVPHRYPPWCTLECHSSISHHTDGTSQFIHSWHLSQLVSHWSLSGFLDIGFIELALDIQNVGKVPPPLLLLCFYCSAWFAFFN